MSRSGFAKASFLALALVAAAAWPAGASFFDVDNAHSTTAGPPYPSLPPVKVNVRPDLTHLDTEIIQLSLKSVLYQESVPPSDLASHIDEYTVGGGGGGGGGGYQAESFFDVFLDVSTVPPQDFPADSFFVVFVELKLPGGQSAPLASDVRCAHAASFFDVFFDVEIPGVGVVSQQIHGETNPLYPVVFSNVQAGGGGEAGGCTADSFFDVFFEVEIPHVGTDPLFKLRLSDAVPEPAALVPLGLALLGLPRILRNSRRGVTKCTR